MADEFQIRSGLNWWPDSSRTRFESGASPSSSSSSSALITSVGSFIGWPSEIADPNFKPLPSIGSVPMSVPMSVSDSYMLFQNTQKVAQDHPHSSQMMGLGLSSHQPMDWNYQTSFNSEAKEYKQFSPHISSSFHMDPATYGSPSQGSLLLLASDNQQPRPNFGNHPSSTYDYSGELSPLWTKVPQFLRNSPPPAKQQSNSKLGFSNNAPFWKAATSAAVNDDIVRSSFLPPSQPQFPAPPTFEKPKNKSEVRSSGTVTKKSGSIEASNKRPRSETLSPSPAFKVKKEKMGDRITALQQLVSPFGKTDTASVLTEAIEYIKYFHEQVNVLSNPYMKSGAPMQHHLQSYGKSEDSEGAKQDLRNKGLCLVPVSSIFPVTPETTMDFWTPTFGGTFKSWNS